MARTPRPVNPDEGPVQALAFDLRALREAAGNPTYRTLAKTAGYSATTLGDAAGGAHLPTLEVTLAYVGACGGDVDAWRCRWQEVNRQVATERAEARGVAGNESEQRTQAPDSAASAAAAESALEPESDPDPALDPDLDPPDDAVGPTAEPQQTAVPTPVHEPSPSHAPRRRVRAFAPWIAVSAALVGVLVAAATGVFAAGGNGAAATGSKAGAKPAHEVPAASGTQCPTVPAQGTSVSFTGTTYGLGANVRTGASLVSPVRFRIPAGCSVGFSGYCLGDVVVDETAGTPDMRWFIIPGVGEVASAIVHGDPPTALTPQPCPDDVPAPAAITLAVSPSGTGGGVVELAASGSRLWIVGFAAYYASTGSDKAPSWHQLGFGGEQTGGGFSSTPLHLPTANVPVPVAAVACLGGDGPTGTIATGVVRPDAPQTLLPPPAQSPAVLTAAEQAACQYPGAVAGD